MMKPEPSDVTRWGVLDFGPMKFLNRSSSGEPGGRLGMSCGGGAFKVWEVAILTTVGSSLAARSAKESGAGRASAGAQNRSTGSRKARRRITKSPFMGFGARIAFPFRRKQGENRPSAKKRTVSLKKLR